MKTIFENDHFYVETGYVVQIGSDHYYDSIRIPEEHCAFDIFRRDYSDSVLDMRCHVEDIPPELFNLELEFIVPCPALREARTDCMKKPTLKDYVDLACKMGKGNVYWVNVWRVAEVGLFGNTQTWRGMVEA